jgi:integrase
MSAILELYRPLTQAPEVSPMAVYLSGLAPTGRRSTLCHLNKVARILGYNEAQEVQWHTIQFHDIQKVVSTMRTEGLSPLTMRCVLGAIRGVLWVCYKENLLTREEYDRLEVKIPRGKRLVRGRHIPEEERLALLAACDRGTLLRRARDRALLLLLSETGIRREELCALTMENIEDNALTFIGKGNKQRWIPLNSVARDAMAAWLALRGNIPGAILLAIDRWDNVSEGNLDGSAVAKIINRLVKDAGTPPLTPHDFRRTFRDRLETAGIAPTTGMQVMGHSDRRTYDSYSRQPLEDMRLAVERI